MPTLEEILRRNGVRHLRPLSPCTDLFKRLHQNPVSLADILDRANFGPGEAREVPDPAQQTVGAREPVTIILASAASSRL
jgi:hypothetical protein